MLIGSISLFVTGFAGNDHASVNLTEGSDLVSLDPYGARLVTDSGCFATLHKRNPMLLEHEQPISLVSSMMKSLFLAFVAIVVSGYAEAATYSRTASLSGQSFLNAFWWQAIADPTNGRVFVNCPPFTEIFV